MGDTKERILWTALKLFAENGYEAVSVSDIAGALGLSKGALYRHYRSKRDIFDSILARMAQRDALQAAGQGLPERPAEEAPEAYRAVGPEQIAAFGKAMFRYWTQDEFAVLFRRMLTLEQYRSEEMGRLYQQYLSAGPLGYTADLLAALGLPQPREEAARFYAPMFLLCSVYDAANDRGAVLAQLDALLENEEKRWKEILSHE